MTLEFVSYDGKYPALCDGRLTIKDTDTGTFYRLDDVLMCDAYASSPAGLISPAQVNGKSTLMSFLRTLSPISMALHR